MANIREFAAPEGIGLRPSEIGVDAVAAAARRGGGFFNQAAEATGDIGRRIASTVTDAGDVAVKYMDHREISAGAKNGAALTSRLNDQWKEAANNADPNDPTVKAKFLEEQLEPELDKFKSGFNTERSQQWAEQFVDQYRKHMFEKTSADMSTLAGIAVKTNYEKTKNLLASSVASDPSSLDFALSSIDHSVGAMADSSPNLDVGQSAKVKSELTQAAKQEIVKSAISGMIQKNPNVDLDAVQKKYGEYINGAEMKMFQKAAQTQAKSNALVEKQNAIAQRQLDDLNVHKSATDVITRNVSVDATGKPLINPKFFSDALEIARKNPDAPSAAATVRTMFDWAESQQNKELKVSDNPAIVKGLMDRLFDPENPTTTIDLMRERAKGNISDHTYTVTSDLVKELQETPLKGPVYQDTMKAAHGTLVLTGVGIPGKDEAGERNYAKFVQSFIPQYLAKSRAGTLEPNALDVKDPNSMISKAMEPFKRGPLERISDYTSMFGGAANSNLTGPGKDVLSTEVIDIPAGMSVQDAVKKYGGGKTVRLPDGRTKALPDGR